MKLVKSLYLIALIAMASPAASQSEIDVNSVWSWIKNKANNVSDSTFENSWAILDATKEGAYSASTYISESYTEAMGGSKMALLWTKETIGKIPKITAQVYNCKIARFDFLSAVTFHGTIILIASGLTTTPTAVVLTGITIYATSKGICYFHDNSKDQLIDDGTINDGTIDDTTADNHNSNIFGQSAHKVSTLSMIGFPRTL